MNHGSLFSGIGGFDLAAQWMGWNNLFHCEWNEFGQKVLKYYWPNAKSYHDITKSTFTEFQGRVDIITGGFPCQPFSTAGKRKGTDDNRYLWPEMLRVIREVKPRYIVGENVRGLVNWNGGMVFEQVCSDLEAEGYEILPVLLPACAVNAPHRRDRIWFVAYSKNIDANRFRKYENYFKQIHKEERKTIWSEFGNIGKQNDATHSKDSRCKSNEKTNRREEYQSFDRNGIRNISNTDGTESNATDSNSWRLEGTEEVGRHGINVERESEFRDATDFLRIGSGEGRNINQSELINENGEERGIITDSDSDRLQGGISSEFNRQFSGTKEYDEKCLSTHRRGIQFENFPTVSPVCNGNDGISYRLDSITFSKWRKESIKAGGNAIVPQVAFEIFKVIEQLNQKL